jgi:hypothetical protein
MVENVRDGLVVDSVLASSSVDLHLMDSDLIRSRRIGNGVVGSAKSRAEQGMGPGACTERSASIATGRSLGRRIEREGRQHGRG